MLITFFTVGTLFARTVGLQETEHLFCLAYCGKPVLHFLEKLSTVINSSFQIFWGRNNSQLKYVVCGYGQRSTLRYFLCVAKHQLAPLVFGRLCTLQCINLWRKSATHCHNCVKTDPCLKDIRCIQKRLLFDWFQFILIF